MGSLVRHLRRAFVLAPFALLASALPVLAADPSPAPVAASAGQVTNVFAPLGIDVVHLDSNLISTLGSFASIYVSLMNGVVVLAMALFAWSSFRHILRGLMDSQSVKTTQGYGGDASTQAIFMNTLKAIMETLAITVIILFVVINGANLALQVAAGSTGLFSVSDTELLPKLMGPFGGVMAKLQSFASMGIILLGVGIAVFKGIEVLREDHYSSYKKGSGEGGQASNLHRTQALIKELGFVMALVVLGFIVIRQGPNIVVSLLGGVGSLIPQTNVSNLQIVPPVPSGAALPSPSIGP
jgi:hypothetical protein